MKKKDNDNDRDVEEEGGRTKWERQPRKRWVGTEYQFKKGRQACVLRERWRGWGVNNEKHFN